MNELDRRGILNSLYFSSVVSRPYLWQFKISKPVFKLAEKMYFSLSLASFETHKN